MWFGRVLHAPCAKSTGWDMEEQICSCLCPTSSVGWGQGCLAMLWWLDVAPDNGCVPRRAQGIPQGSQWLMGAAEPQPEGFVVLSVSVSPWGRSQEQHGLGG